MKLYKKIYFGEGYNERQVVYFGQPTTKEELDGMFALRYKVYLEHNYIDKNLFPNNKEKDNYDTEGKCDYLVAIINKEVVGSLRLIQDYYLPTERECFQFDEPDKIKSIPRDRRVEIGRLVAKRYKINNTHLPRHLTLIGLLGATLDLSNEKDIQGGYSFIKSSLNNKLKKLGIPFHTIEPYKKIYRGVILHKYFNQENDPVFPIYFLKKEIGNYFDSFFSSKLFFKKIGKEEYKFKGITVFKVLIHRLSGLIT